MGKNTGAVLGTLSGGVLGGVVGSTFDQGRAAQKEAEKVAAENRAAAAKQADLADQAMNKANAKSPDVTAALAASKQSALSGLAGTMLTGTAGATDNLLLGKKTLLGA